MHSTISYNMLTIEITTAEANTALAEELRQLEAQGITSVIRKDSDPVKLYHATPRRNLDSIRTTGLDPNRSQGTCKEIWLHTRSRTPWEILHTINRHKCDISEIVIIQCHVPRGHLRRKWRGIWTTAGTITEFQSITNASELAECH